MNKKIAVAVVGITTGIAIYLVTKMIREKNTGKRNERTIKPKQSYSYEYSL